MKAISKKLPLFVLLIFVSLFFLAQVAQANDGRSLYVLAKEENLKTLAEETGIDAELLAAMNNLSPLATLAIGQSVWLPEEPEETIAIKKGDTLWDLAKKYHTTVQVLARENNIKDARSLRIGQALKIPLGDIAEEPEAVIAVAKISREIKVATRGGSYAWPLKGIITSKYGKRGSGFHHGLDIAAATGANIAAIKSGQVVQAGWYSGIYGNTVTLDHGNGEKSFYAHLSKILVKEGQIVKTGQIIAKVGESGNATGPHLHLQIAIDGDTIDPLLYLR